MKNEIKEAKKKIEMLTNHLLDRIYPILSGSIELNKGEVYSPIIFKLITRLWKRSVDIPIKN